MALTLKTTGIALNLELCLAVDDDGTTIKEFVSSDVDANKTIDAAVVVGSSTWKGTSRGYFQTLSNGSFNFKGIAFASGHKATVAQKDTDGFALFFATAGAGNGSGTGPGRAVIAVQSGGINIIRNSSTLQLGAYAGNNKGAGTTVMPSDGTTKFSAGISHVDATGDSYYYGLESGSLAADGTTTSSETFGGTVTIDSVGGFSGQGNFPNKYHIVAVFDRALTLTEMQSLHDDWFGTLFDTGGSGATISVPLETYAITWLVPTVTGAGVTLVDVPLATYALAFFAPTVVASGGGAGTITTDPLGNNTGSLLAGEAGVTVYVYNKSTGALVVTKTGVSVNGSSQITFSDALLTAGTQYRCVIVLASGAEGMGTFTAT